MQYLSVQEDQTLAFDTTSIPVPNANQCLIKVHAFGINRADLLQKSGKYPPPKGESPILGLEVCGEIVVCGDLVAGWQEGDKVFGLVAGGGYAQFAVIASAHMLRLPTAFNYAKGAASAETYLTAFQSLFTIADLQPRHNVLIHAGASGVGAAAIQLAKQIGCKVVATVGTDEKSTFCSSIGADHTINYHKECFVEWQKNHLKEGFDVILDVVSGDYVNKNIQVCALDGNIITLAILGGRFCEKFDMAKMLMKRITLSASTLRNRSDNYKSQLVERFCAMFSEPIQSGKLSPPIDSCVDWKLTNNLHQKMAANQNKGKLVAMIEHP